MNKNQFILFFIIIIILILLFNLFNNFLNNKIIKEGFESLKSVYFLDKNQLLNVLIENKDNYYNRFDKYDLFARKINSIQEYLNKISSSPVNLSESQKEKIKKSIEFANKRLKEISFPGFDGVKCSKLVWKIGAIDGKEYENGLPHTRDDIIILPILKINNKNIIELAQLLVHEKVHIYQKIYKDDISQYLENNNIKFLKKRNQNDMIRSNPDLDDNIYYDKNKVYLAKYNSTEPTSIEDVTYNHNGTQKSEHPFEKMAIEIEDLI